jgi:hypothetical protein
MLVRSELPPCLCVSTGTHRSCYQCTTALGGAAGAVTRSEGRVGPVAAAARRASFPGGHIAGGGPAGYRCACVQAGRGRLVCHDAHRPGRRRRPGLLPQPQVRSVLFGMAGRSTSALCQQVVAALHCTCVQYWLRLTSDPACSHEFLLVGGSGDFGELIIDNTFRWLPRSTACWRAGCSGTARG